MTRYAAQTTVSVEKSKAEIERMLAKYGADSFASGWDSTRAIIQFDAAGRRVKFVLPMPSQMDKAFVTTRTGKTRTADAAFKEWEQACRQRWRALALAIKAKLECVETGIETFEEAFLAQIVMPDGKTVGEHSRPMIAAAYETGNMQPLLPGPTS